MAWNWIQKINYSDTTNNSKILRDTGWKSPNNIIQDIDASLTTAQTSFIYPNNSHSDMIMKYSKISDYEPDAIWNNLSNLNGTTGFSYILSQNVNPTKNIYDTPNIIAYDYNFNIPTGSTISGIQVKICKSASGDTNISDMSESDYNLLISHMTNYTYDKLVTLGTSSFTNNIYNNYANTYIKENVSYPYGNIKIDNPPIGTWGDSEQVYLYGGFQDKWYNNSNPWTVDIVNKSDFSVIFGATQHIFKGGETIPIFSTVNGTRDWYKTKYTNESKISYQNSKIYNIQVKVFYEIDNTGYTLIDRPSIYSSANTLKTDDTYFKFQQCFNGICYSYVKNLDNIYDISLMTGDGNSINNMYNEYNIIDEYLSNLYIVDVATTEKIDLSAPYFKIDNITLRPNHLILLMDQTSAQTNDIYKVNNNYFLENANLLTTREESYRAKVYVGLGTHNQKQYFLEDENNEFPIINEIKNFVSGHSYIIKHKIDYNIFNTNTTTIYDLTAITSNQSKILFTDYNLARTLSETINWSKIYIPASSTTIRYLDNIYKIDTQYDRIYYTMTGNTSLSSNTMFNWSGNTIFKVDNNFYTKSSIGDHILVSLINNSFVDDEIIPAAKLNYFTTIKNIDSEYLTVNNEIPVYILNDIYNSGYSFRIRNLHYCSATTTDIADYLNISPYGEIITFTDVINSVEINPKITSDYYKYFDYNLIILSSNTSYTFTSNSQYQDYKLKPFLDKIGLTTTNIYNEAYILSGYTIEEVYIDYTDRMYPIQSSMYKIYGTLLSEKFKAYTYIDFGKLSKSGTNIISPYIFSGDSARTLIYEVYDDYMLIEKPKIDLSLSISSATYDIINVSKLQDISDILYDIYLNYPHSYYYKYSDNVINKICSEYALILKNDYFVRNIATGILYQKNDLFNLDIFNINIDDNYNHLDDVNLIYTPIELIDIGIDKKTKLPIPLDIKNIDLNNVSNLWFTGTTTGNEYITSIYE